MLTNQKTNKRGFGVSEIIGVGTILIIAAVIVIPGLQRIATTLMETTEEWIDGKFGSIFNIDVPGT